MDGEEPGHTVMPGSRVLPDVLQEDGPDHPAPHTKGNQEPGDALRDDHSSVSRARTLALYASCPLRPAVRERGAERRRRVLHPWVPRAASCGLSRTGSANTTPWVASAG